LNLKWITLKEQEVFLNQFLKQKNAILPKKKKKKATQYCWTL
jgi:hypothetical protein